MVSTGDKIRDSLGVICKGQVVHRRGLGLELVWEGFNRSKGLKSRTFYFLFFTFFLFKVYADRMRGQVGYRFLVFQTWG